MHKKSYSPSLRFLSTHTPRSANHPPPSCHFQTLPVSQPTNHNMQSKSEYTNDELERRRERHALGKQKEKERIRAYHACRKNTSMQKKRRGGIYWCQDIRDQPYVLCSPSGEITINSSNQPTTPTNPTPPTTSSNPSLPKTTTVDISTSSNFSPPKQSRFNRNHPLVRGLFRQPK